MMMTEQNLANVELKHAESDVELLACYEVMLELRPNLTSPESYLAQVKRQSKQGYKILAAWNDKTPLALAGYRNTEMLIHGSFIYVDDLVTKRSVRGKKLGEQLLEHIFCESSKHHYTKIILDTGISNSLAQRFYFRLGMLPVGIHFCYELTT